MDSTRRDLERRLKGGDPQAREKLRLADNRAGIGEAAWIADLLEMNGLTDAPLRACTAGVRAVLTAAAIEADVGPDARWRAAEITPATPSDSARIASLFGLPTTCILAEGRLVKVALFRREAEPSSPGFPGPKLGPSGQEPFLDAVRRETHKAPKKRKPAPTLCDRIALYERELEKPELAPAARTALENLIAILRSQADRKESRRKARGSAERTPHERRTRRARPHSDS